MLKLSLPDFSEIFQPLMRYLGHLIRSKVENVLQFGDCLMHDRKMANPFAQYTLHKGRYSDKQTTKFHFCYASHVAFRYKTDCETRSSQIDFA